MNLKKLIVTGSAVALMLSSAAPAFAGSPDNVAIIKNNNTSASANSGMNTQDNLGGNTVVAGKGSGNIASVDSSGTRSMTTGSAKAKAVVVANVQVGCGCEEDNGTNGHGQGGNDNLAVVKRNNTSADANSGVNFQDNYENNTVKAGKGSGNNASVDESGSRTMNTGDAKAKAKSWVVVNSNVSSPF